MPRVYNKHHKDAPPDAVYIGRPSIWGNPFSHTNSNVRDIVPVSSREEAVKAYEAWLLAQPEVVALVKQELKGKDLVCWCAPAACHGDVLLALANGEDDVLMALP